MRLIVLLFCIARCYCDMQVLIDHNGNYNITINKQLWLRSSRTAIYTDDRWYSTENNTLPLHDISNAHGLDPILGAWNETILTYHLIRDRQTIPIVGRIRQWSTVSALTFYLDTGNTALPIQQPLSKDDVRTVFPSFLIESMNENDERGYFTVEGHVPFFDISYLTLNVHFSRLYVRCPC